MRVKVHARVYQERSIGLGLKGRNAENEPVSRIKMADYRREYGSAIAIFETKPLYEKRQIESGASTILSP